ncbi:hypothetical protein [uncultured Aquimarina sp.]|uniref:leucine-rich repeat domain-containing protein n=1 Tax=uncultured Aquimarina sp. TaxID=575652 RepID=UPI002608A29C|nr:hypothetical protein [uncultured Aquimarina sp.]
MKEILYFFVFFIFLSCTKPLSDKQLEENYTLAVKNKEWKKAVLILDEVILRNPENSISYFSRAFASTNILPQDLDKIIADLNTYLEVNKNDEKAIYLRFQAYFKNKQYEKSLTDINSIIELKGEKPFLLSWKANCAFAAKKFELSAAIYEKRLSLPGSYDDLQNNYYYLIFSKYFSGNKEAALWDTGFLESRGFKEDKDLMKSISNNMLEFEEVSNFVFPKITLRQFEEIINNSCSDLDIFLGKNYFRSELLEKLAHVERAENLKELLVKKEEVFTLNLSYVGLKSLPKEIFQFINLQALDLSGNQFSDIENILSDLRKLPNLKILQLNRLKLRVVPKNLYDLSNLEVLDLGGNYLKKIDEDLGRLNKLKFLSFRNNNKLQYLPKSIGNLKCLERFDISGTWISELREELAQCTELISISANACKIKTLPENIGNLVKLKHLNLAANKIEKIPASIGELKNLEDLSLGSNEILELPDEFSSLANLSSCSLEFNKFKKFPVETLGLEKVLRLWVHNNSFENIPVKVAQLPSLTDLLVDHEIISDKNIESLKKVNPKLRVIRHDTRKYVKGKKRKN